MSGSSLQDLANRHQYLNKNIKYIFGKKIWEYDIRQANINALRATGRISQDLYDRLASASKQYREVYIGKEIRLDKTIQDSIYEGIDGAKLQFLQLNNIHSEDVLRIANDSIYVIAPIPQTNLIIDINGYPLTFVLKGTYTSFLQLCNNVLFFYANEANDYNVDIKGISDDLLPLHQSFIGFICSILEYYDNGGKDIALRYFNDFYTSYINKTLPLEYYREFNATSGYRVSFNNETFFVNSGESIPRDALDIQFNLMDLRWIYSYLLSAN